MKENKIKFVSPDFLFNIIQNENSSFSEFGTKRKFVILDSRDSSIFYDIGHIVYSICYEDQDDLDDVCKGRKIYIYGDKEKSLKIYSQLSNQFQDVFFLDEGIEAFQTLYPYLVISRKTSREDYDISKKMLANGKKKKNKD